MSPDEVTYLGMAQVRSMPEFRREGHKPPAPSTVVRWYAKGVRGRRLRTRLLGGRRVTTRQWLDEFLAHDPLLRG